MVKALTILLTLLMAGCAAKRSVTALHPAAGDWRTTWQGVNGEWQASALQIAGEHAATFSGHNGRIHFYAISGNRTWEGYWIEDRPGLCEHRRDGSSYWGVAIFTFNAAYDRFEGTWDMCGDGNRAQWKGSR